MLGEGVQFLSQEATVDVGLGRNAAAGIDCFFPNESDIFPEALSGSPPFPGRGAFGRIGFPVGIKAFFFNEGDLTFWFQDHFLVVLFVNPAPGHYDVPVGSAQHLVIASLGVFAAW